MKKGEYFKYKGYKGSIEFSTKDNCYHGKIINTKDLVSYESNTVQGLYEEFKNTADYYIQLKKTC